MTAELEIISALTRTPPDRQRQFRQACRSQASTNDALGGVWFAFAEIGQREGQVVSSLARRSLSIDDLNRIRDVLDGAAMSWFAASSVMWDVWISCRNAVIDELGNRQRAMQELDTIRSLPTPQATSPRLTMAHQKRRKPPAARKTQTATVQPVRRGDAILAMLSQYPEGVPTRTITKQFGGAPARQALRRLRQAGKVESRDGVNVGVAVAGIPEPDVRQSA